MYDMIKVICVTQRERFASDDEFLMCIENVCKSKKAYKIILREKDICDDAYKMLAKKAISICERYNQDLLLHSHFDVARELHHTSVHYTYNDFIEHGKEFDYVGVSVHSVKEATICEEKGANYLIAGHIYATDCKKGLEPKGIDYLNSICSAVNIPVYAIGGITAENKSDCIKAGASGVCVMSSLMRIDVSDIINMLVE